MDRSFCYTTVVAARTFAGNVDRVFVGVVTGLQQSVKRGDFNSLLFLYIICIEYNYIL